ncbi:V-type proton ATPase 16 kDa proteolipid [Musa troglodytarum]|uniref:V-type proton ATPase proteolipid subunit n=1 Tax=Musa troglodytarum TaxID=320322 RepID=A0A9E7FVQ2_9LILI|nr:V-type proton ATPase 16 kDa proteolipid [Musa troglodytarum]
MSTFSGDETAPFFGFLGAAAALVFSCMGAAYGTAKSGVGVASMGVMRPELVMKSIVPVVMAGVLGIYGLIIAVIISTGINPKAKSYYLFDGYAHLSSGLACGLAGLSAGMAIGIVGDAGVRNDMLFAAYKDLFAITVYHSTWPIQFCSTKSQRTTAKTVCRNDSDSHLCGSSCPLWSHCWHHPFLSRWSIPSRLRRLPQIRVTFLDLYYISIISHWNLLVLLSYGQLRIVVLRFILGVSKEFRAHNPQLLSYYLGAPSEREMTLGTLTLEKKRKLDDSDQYLDLSSDTSILFFGNILHCNFTALKVTVQFLSGTKQLCNCSKSRSQSQGYY